MTIKFFVVAKLYQIFVCGILFWATLYVSNVTLLHGRNVCLTEFWTISHLTSWHISYR